MTEISTIHAALVTLMGTTLFSGHFRLNPYALSSNNVQFLEKGWGVAMGPARNTNRNVGQRVSVERECTLILTRRAFARQLDPATKGDTEKTLLEDVQILVDKVESHTFLAPDEGKYLIKYRGDSGIQQIREDDASLLSVSVSVTVEYYRTIT